MLSTEFSQIKKGTSDFLKNLRKFKTSSKFKFVSFDIENLLPSIPLNKVIDIAAKLLLNKFGTISKDEIKKLVKFAPKMFHFSLALFNKQRNGVTMGSPLAPISLKEFFIIDLSMTYEYLCLFQRI